jgi:hypothetical protein
MYRLIAISKTRYGSINFAIIEEDGTLEAIARCKDGSCFAITFVETITCNYQSVLDFVRLQERIGKLK